MTSRTRLPNLALPLVLLAAACASPSSSESRPSASAGSSAGTPGGDPARSQPAPLGASAAPRPAPSLNPAASASAAGGSGKQANVDFSVLEDLPKWDMDDVFQKPTPEHQRLFYWVGQWQSEEEFPPTPYMPGAGTGKGLFRFSVEHDLWVRLEYNTVGGPEGQKRYFGYMCIWGYDRYKKHYEQWLFHHMGAMEYSVGEWRDDHFYFESESPIGGMPHKSRYHFTPRSDDEWTFFAEETFDLVKWVPTFRATLRRLGGHMPAKTAKAAK